MGDFSREYEALTNTAALVDFTGRTRIEMTGNDRAALLHNLCTNNIRDLSPGKVCEAFLTNIQAKVLAHLYVFSLPESLILETVAQQAETILTHLDRYLIREDVTLHDRTDKWGELLVAGPQASNVLSILECALPATSGSCVQIDDTQVIVCHISVTGEADFLVLGPREAIDDVREKLLRQGVVAAGADAYEAARIEHGTPQFGQDITPDNLAQEVSRDDETINFTKGCYLGQETIARIDALGHVNRSLRGVRFFDKEMPAIGGELTGDLTKEQRVVGKITSVCASPKLGAPLALAYLQRRQTAPGTKLSSAWGEAEVIELPLGSP